MKMQDGENSARSGDVISDSPTTSLSTTYRG